ISFEASCLRIANISSCLRIVEAFSTWCSSAKASNSVGDLDLRSWSFISRMRVGPVENRLARKSGPVDEGERKGAARRVGRWGGRGGGREVVGGGRGGGPRNRLRPPVFGPVRVDIRLRSGR